MDALDRAIVNELQGGLPICDRPFAEIAERLGTDEHYLIERLKAMLEERLLTRFGPMFDAERLGGGVTLAAMSIPESDLDQVAERVNAHPEVAHNYVRDHHWNMWFVVATETPEQIGEVLDAIESETGYPVLNLPKEEEFFIGLRLEA